jgi:hypothetical protein
MPELNLSGMKYAAKDTSMCPLLITLHGLEQSPKVILFSSLRNLRSFYLRVAPFEFAICEVTDERSFLLSIPHRIEIIANPVRDSTGWHYHQIVRG